MHADDDEAMDAVDGSARSGATCGVTMRRPDQLVPLITWIGPHLHADIMAVRLRMKVGQSTCANVTHPAILMHPADVAFVASLMAGTWIGFGGFRAVRMGDRTALLMVASIRDQSVDDRYGALVEVMSCQSATLRTLDEVVLHANPNGRLRRLQSLCELANSTELCSGTSCVRDDGTARS